MKEIYKEIQQSQVTTPLPHRVAREGGIDSMTSSPSNQGLNDVPLTAFGKGLSSNQRTNKQGDGYFPHSGRSVGWVFYLSLFIVLAACSSKPSSVPQQFTEVNEEARIFPDYRDVTIPPNIAPLNFMVTDSLADAFVMQAGDLVCGAGEDGKFYLDSLVWRRILSDAKGRDLTVNLFARRSGQWVHFHPFLLHVAEEEIDSYLSYRLIEPGYELYRQLGLYQRNLTNFTEAVIYENNRAFEDENNHCVNCHNYQAYNTNRMTFHVRGNHGGTIITDGAEAHKIAIKHDSILAAGVYPSWHPTLPLLAFSSNKTGQVFHMMHPEKIEVLDEASDLLLYDPVNNTVKNVIRTKDALETFPCWAPDGNRLFYCVAKMPPSVLEDYTAFNVALKYDSLLYDIYSIPFDPETRTFGTPRIEVNASADHHSCSVPRISPNGRYLLYTLGDYGQFHIWHQSADLWVKDLEVESSASHSSQPSTPTSQPSTSSVQPSTFNFQLSTSYPLTAANSSEADSYHSWSSNGKWIAFVSRREDQTFSRVFITYFDKQGQPRKAFLLPQHDPEYNTLLLKSYNVPELTKTAVQVSVETLKHVIYHTDAEVATYQE